MTKVLLIFLLLATTTFATTIDLDELRPLWSSWKTYYQKSYQSGEEAARFGIFVENYKKVVDYNHKDNGVRLVLNKFADLTIEEFSAHFSGSLLGDMIEYDSDNIIDYSSFDLPASVDWRINGAVTPVQNQGACGSCWAWSAVGALEGLNFITTGHLESFSVQQIIDCDTQDHGCNGGWYYRAFNYTSFSGIELESDYPYTATAGQCQYNQSKAQKVNKGLAYVPTKNSTALKAAIALQPVSIAVQSDQTVFQFYSSGVVTSDCGSDIDHGVLAVGYETINGVEAFIVKNTYGADWGQEGYIYISTDETANNGLGVCGILFKPVVPTI